MEKWSKICSRLYVWDYTTDFKNYVHPHPNWFTLGANVRLFQKFGVQGLFEQGAYAGPGAEMAEMRAWVLAQLLWNPQQDDQKLIKEFLAGYYGEAAAKPIFRYFELMHEASAGVYLGCYLRNDQSAHLNFATLSAAEKLWQEAENAVSGDDEKLIRVRLAHLPVRNAFLKIWQKLRRECWEQNQTWPLSESCKVVAEEFRAVAEGIPGKEWTKVGVVYENGPSVNEYLKAYAENPLDKFGVPPPLRLKNPPPPRDLKKVDSAHCVDLQDNVGTLLRGVKVAGIYFDDAASDLRAIRLTPDNTDRMFEINGAKLPARVSHGKWNIHVVARLGRPENVAKDSVAFSIGVFDSVDKTNVLDFKMKAEDLGNEYRSILIGSAELNANRTIWVSSADNPGLNAIWIDRIYLVPTL